MPSPEEFTSEFISLIRPGSRILDMGAGIGTFSQMFADKGALVTAVDIKIREGLDENIASKKLKVEEFVMHNSNDIYDVAFMRNILQFLDKEWVFEILFPWLDEHLTRGGVVGIETFYKEPMPPFDHALRSLYTIRELAEHFLLWQELYSEQYEEYGPDMSGNFRQFFLSDLIVRKAS